MKVKSSAKGDQKIPKERRFAFNLELSDIVAAEISKAPDGPVFFDKLMSVGQMVDAACKALAIKQVTDFDNVKETQLCVAIQQEEAPFMKPLGFAVKLEELKQQGFEQGDTLIFYRALEFQ